MFLIQASLHQVKTAFGGISVYISAFKEVEPRFILIVKNRIVRKKQLGRMPALIWIALHST